MAKLRCVYCNEMIDEKDKECSTCGAKVHKKYSNGKVTYEEYEHKNPDIKSREMANRLISYGKGLRIAGIVLGAGIFIGLMASIFVAIYNGDFEVVIGEVVLMIITIPPVIISGFINEALISTLGYISNNIYELNVKNNK